MLKKRGQDMKRFLILFLAAAMLLSLCACGKKKNEEIIGEGIVNPVNDQASDPLAQTTGSSLTPPAGAENVSYQTIDGEEQITQMNFTLDGKQYTYRVLQSTEYKDISGMNYEWTGSDAAGVGGCIAEISFIEGAQGKINWFDVVSGMVYSLSVDGGASSQLLSSVANEVFKPAEETGSLSADIAIPAPPENLLPAGFSEIMSGISQNYHQGTAGCSLSAAAYAARLLDWCTDANISADEIKQSVSAFAGGLSGDAAGEFPSQIEGILNAVKQVTAKDGAALLLDCGYASMKYPWDAGVVSNLISALS